MQVVIFMNRKRIIIFFILYLLFGISVNIVHPVTTTYVKNLNLPDAYFGFFSSLMSLGQVVGAIFFGYLSDKIGRKWLVCIGLVGYAFSQLGFGFLNSIPLIILLFRFLGGFFISAPSTLFVSLCIDYSDTSKKVRNLSIATSCYILGTSFGYEIGGALYNYLDFSISQVFIFQICFTIITSLLFGLFIKDVYKNKLELSNSDNHNKNKYNINNKTIGGLVYLLLFSLMVLTVGQILINKYLDTYIIHIGYEPSTLGHYVLITGILSAISNILVIPFIKKIKSNKLAYCLTIFIFLSAILTFITFLVKINILYLLFSTHVIYIIIKGLITPLEQNELSTYINDSNNGKITGARQTILSIGNVLGPLIGSAVYVSGSPFIFIVGAIIILISLVMYISYFAIKKKKHYV